MRVKISPSKKRKKASALMPLRRKRKRRTRRRKPKRIKKPLMTQKQWTALSRKIKIMK